MMAEGRKSMETELAIIGGGPAGLAAALAAREAGVEDILILERDSVLGGILNQCIHNGFGLHTFHEELTGPEYAYRFIEQVEEVKIPYLTDTMVVDLEEEEGEKYITAMNSRDGLLTIRAKAIILAMGCRERPRGEQQVVQVISQAYILLIACIENAIIMHSYMHTPWAAGSGRGEP